MIFEQCAWAEVRHSWIRCGYCEFCWASRISGEDLLHRQEQHTDCRECDPSGIYMFCLFTVVYWIEMLSVGNSYRGMLKQNAMAHGCNQLVLRFCVVEVVCTSKWLFIPEKLNQVVFKSMHTVVQQVHSTNGYSYYINWREELFRSMWKYIKIEKCCET